MSPFVIINDFFSNLFRSRSRLHATLSLILFFGLPLVAVFHAHTASLVVAELQYSSFVSIFAIFAALLFGAQISAFSIYRSLVSSLSVRQERADKDDILRAAECDLIAERQRDLRTAFKSINSGISYLILGAVMLLGLILWAIVYKVSNSIVTYVIIGASVHFLAVLMRTVLECHLVFDAGYSDSEVD